MLRPAQHTTREASKKDIFPYMAGTVVMISSILWSCTSTNQDKIPYEEPEVTNPALILGLRWSVKSQNLPTDLPDYNPLNLELRWPIQMLPTHEFNDSGNMLIENTKDIIESIQVHPIGEWEITIGQKNIIEIRMDTK